MTNNYLENSMPESEIRKYSLFPSSRDIGTNSLEPYKRPFEEEIQNPFRQSNSAPRTGSPRAPVPAPPSSGEYNPFRSSFTTRHLQRQEDAIKDSSDVYTNGWKISFATLDEKTIDECIDELFSPFQHNQLPAAIPPRVPLPPPRHPSHPGSIDFPVLSDDLPAAYSPTLFAPPDIPDLYFPLPEQTVIPTYAEFQCWTE
jgi:hypothetical protein